MKKSNYYAALGLLMASTALTAAPALAQAELKGNLGYIRPMSDWRIGEVAAPAENVPGYCASVNKFEQGFTLALAKSKTGSYSLALDFPYPRFAPGQEQSVTLQHSKGYHFQTRARAANSKSLIIQLGEEDLMFAAMADEGYLSISLPDVDMKVSLVTFANSARKLKDCVEGLPEMPVEIREVRAVPPQFPPRPAQETVAKHDLEAPVKPALELEKEMADIATASPVPVMQDETPDVDKAEKPAEKLAEKPVDVVTAKPAWEDAPVEIDMNNIRVIDVPVETAAAPAEKIAEKPELEGPAAFTPVAYQPVNLLPVGREPVSRVELHDSDLRMIGLANELDAVSPQAGRNDEQAADAPETEMPGVTAAPVAMIEQSPLDDALEALEADALDETASQAPETAKVAVPVQEGPAQEEIVSSEDEINKVQAFKEMERRRQAAIETPAIPSVSLPVAPTIEETAAAAPPSSMTEDIAISREDELRRQRIEALSGMDGTTEDVPIVVIQEELMQRQADLERQARAQAEEAEFLARRRMLVESIGEEQGLSSAADANVVALQEQLDRLKAENESLQNRQIEAENTISNMRKTTHELEVARTSMEHNRLETQAVMDSQNRLAEQMQAQSGQLSALNSELALKEQQITGLQQRIAALKAGDAERAAEIEAEIARIEKQANEAVAQEKQRLEAELAQKKHEAETRLSQMEAELARKQRDADAKAQALETALQQKTAVDTSTAAPVEARVVTPAALVSPRAPDVPIQSPVALTGMTPPAAGVSPVVPVVVPAPVIMENTIETTAVKPVPVQHPAGRAVLSEDRYERVTGFVDHLMQAYQPRAGGNMDGDARLLRSAGYQDISLSDIEPQAGGVVGGLYGVPALNIDQIHETSLTPFINDRPLGVPAVMRAETPVVDDTKVQVQAAAMSAPVGLNDIEKMIGHTQLENVKFYKAVEQNGIGLQQAWTARHNGLTVKGGMARYDHLNAVNFESHANGFVTAFAESLCGGADFEQNMHRVAPHVFEALLNCNTERGVEMVSMVLYLDGEHKFTVLHHVGDFSAAGLLDSINGTLIQYISAASSALSPDVRFKNMYDNAARDNESI